MALVHEATITPSKIEIVRGWVPRQIWGDGVDPGALDMVGAYRFDDPDGEVGVEVHLVRTADGRVLQVPLTYRAAEYPDAGEGFVTTMQHSVLGRRWIYDGCADLVCVSAMVAAAMTGGHEAGIEFPDGRTREVTTKVHGSGSAGTSVPSLAAVHATSDATTTTVDAGEVRLVLAREVGVALDGRWSLTGTWPGHDEPALLAAVR